MSNNKYRCSVMSNRLGHEVQLEVYSPDKKYGDAKVVLHNNLVEIFESLPEDTAPYMRITDNGATRTADQMFIARADIWLSKADARNGLLSDYSAIGECTMAEYNGMHPAYWGKLSPVQKCWNIAYDKAVLWYLKLDAKILGGKLYSAGQLRECATGEVTVTPVVLAAESNASAQTPDAAATAAPVADTAVVTPQAAPAAADSKDAPAPKKRSRKKPAKAESTADMSALPVPVLPVKEEPEPLPKQDEEPMPVVAKADENVGVELPGWISLGSEEELYDPISAPAANPVSEPVVEPAVAPAVAVNQAEPVVMSAPVAEAAPQKEQPSGTSSGVFMTDTDLMAIYNSMSDSF